MEMECDTLAVPSDVSPFFLYIHDHTSAHLHHWTDCTAVRLSAKHAGLSLDGRGKVRGEHPVVNGSRVALFFQMDKEKELNA